ncbi:MAG: ATP-binding cassette domain-containing protein, partial [Faecousia sp.]
MPCGMCWTPETSKEASMLEIKNMTVCYGDRPTVRDFSMNLKQGQIASLVGESGSGKTTVIRA